MQGARRGIVEVAKRTAASDALPIDQRGRLGKTRGDQERLRLERAQETADVEAADGSLQVARAGPEVIGRRDGDRRRDRRLEGMLPQPFQEDIASQSGPVGKDRSSRLVPAP